MTAGAIDRLLTLPVDLIRRVQVDPLDPGGELDGVPILSTRCELQHTTAGEVHDGRVMVTGWRAILPAAVADVELSGWDALRLADGELLELDGDPWEVRHPTSGAVHHVEASVRRSR